MPFISRIYSSPTSVRGEGTREYEGEPGWTADRASPLPGVRELDIVGRSRANHHRNAAPRADGRVEAIEGRNRRQSGGYRQAARYRQPTPPDAGTSELVRGVSGLSYRSRCAVGSEARRDTHLYNHRADNPSPERTTPQSDILDAVAGGLRLGICR